MKRALLIILILFSAALSTVAQDSTIRFNAKQIIAFYPFNTILPGEILLGYERIMKPGVSMDIDLSWIYHDIFVCSEGFVPGKLLFDEDVGYDDSPAIGIKLQAGYRRYRNNEKMQAPVGFYINPQILYKYSKTTESIIVNSQVLQGELDVWKNVAGVKLLFGIQSVLSGRFLINYYGGIGYRVIFQKERIFLDPYEGQEPDYEDSFCYLVSHSPTFHLGISIGFAFRK